MTDEELLLLQAEEDMLAGAGGPDHQLVKFNGQTGLYVIGDEMRPNFDCILLYSTYGQTLFPDGQVFPKGGDDDPPICRAANSTPPYDVARLPWDLAASTVEILRQLGHNGHCDGCPLKDFWGPDKRNKPLCQQSATLFVCDPMQCDQYSLLTFKGAVVVGTLRGVIRKTFTEIKRQGLGLTQCILRFGSQKKGQTKVPTLEFVGQSGDLRTVAAAMVADAMRDARQVPQIAAARATPAIEAPKEKEKEVVNEDLF